ncbi:MAG: hypothetical protein E5Y55_32510 [Mesorhizobium sp.]|uniref:hypothetical protein n=1 Tax=Mesorhizobium sp. TaxID=1871066 RepID=UPI000FE87692|nr:hypothetical protein [Mesorhizobium sp.]RWO26580.1 MAG: hypothetical protein EOS09_08450 [Mesorhizobium sp.]RWO97123.1 MAG: hypothetical protein EOQ99_32340 [Mesorhizobium sp.]RWP09865.1 MAG: hypothetical protein EOR00_31845 [Mesorhizobium sp.]TIL30681.1 MAG: hypothetical protein E5Y82_31540 [Mesorhizobium sp.]TIM38908.1 MAG: hypothetical protein E5Y55_32510 [Mesorhizobium sp.]
MWWKRFSIDAAALQGVAFAPALTILQASRRPSSGCRHLLPVNGEKDAVIKDFANLHRRRKSAKVAASFFLPVYGEKCPAGQ